jgi:hypothetical protein
MEQKERECIANAFESYSNWYGSQNAEEVKQLAGGNPDSTGVPLSFDVVFQAECDEHKAVESRVL